MTAAFNAWIMQITEKNYRGIECMNQANNRVTEFMLGFIYRKGTKQIQEQEYRQENSQGEPG